MKKLLLISLMIGVLVMTSFGVVSAMVCTPGESCDDGDDCTIGDTCDAQGICAGTPIQDCQGEGYCGDRIINQQSEECDWFDFGDATCESEMGEGYVGTLSCTMSDSNPLNNCLIDTSNCQLPECKVTVLSPESGEYYDPLWINWTYSGDCNPSTYTIQYGESCDTSIWHTIETVDSEPIPMSYWWDPALDDVPSGEYCIRVRMDQGTGTHVSGDSGIWYLDLTPPEVSLNVQTPQQGDCEDDEEGTSDACYVNHATEIKLSCSDSGADWQSGVDYREYRYRVYNEDTELWGEWTEWEEAMSFYFLEDSRHELEYRCFDKVGKVDTETKNFIVDSVGPIFEDTVVGEPMVCIDNECYINQNTKICVDAYDPEPHPVGLDTITCWSNWWAEDNSGDPDDILRIALNNGCFYFHEDSYHQLICEATDLLGNKDRDLVEQFIVDTQAPNTRIGFEGPYYYHEDEVQWIDTVSRVVLTSADPEPHPVGVDKTYYRVERLKDNSWCYRNSSSQWQETPKDDQSWQEYTAPFGIEESCHVIEYYSTDLLGNEEHINVEFVFSDHTAPKLDLEVGEYSHDCNGIWEALRPQCEDDWDWIVTMGTPITLSCEDQGNHPSEVREICYTIYWDKDTEEPTEECVSNDEVTFWFEGSCRHRVEYTCYDNVNKSSSGLKVFKVIGENFPISLDKKWNLISVPVNLLSSNVEEVFGDDENIEEVWSYEGGEWFYYIPGDEDSNLVNIVPGRGYWVKTSDSTDLIVGGSLFEAGNNPGNSVPISSGWNLIGHYGLASKPRICALASIFNKWSTLVGYDSAFYDAYIMNPGEGYWFFAQGDDSYAYANKACLWGP
ncbi:MAG: hypothetical protein PVJ67_00385 [Candidatus Pacearchaeota archaeon]|jgi:hypothetical protein